MTLSLNTLLLCKGVVEAQSLTVAGGRQELEFWIVAKEELEAAIAEAESAPNRNISGTKGKPRHNGRVTERVES